MNELPGVFTAFAAGLLSFLSPCVLPLIPSYLTFLTGSALNELRADERGAALKRRILSRSIAFSLGFTVVFVLLGFALSSSAALFGGAARRWGVAAGIAVMVLGLNFIFDFLKFLNFEVRSHSGKRPAGFAGAFAFGAAFAAGWSPCIGPILASILLLAGQGTSGRAVALLVSYSAGLALPFLLTGLFFGRLEAAIRAMSKRMRLIKSLSGIFLVAIGLSMAMGSFQDINGMLSRAGYALAAAADKAPIAARLAAVAVHLSFAGLSAALALSRGRTFGEALRRPAALVPFAAFVLLAAAEGAGLISSAELAAAWLLYQGI